MEKFNEDIGVSEKKSIFSLIEFAGIISLSALSSFVLPGIFGGSKGGSDVVFPVWIGGMSFTWVLVLYFIRRMKWKKGFWIGAVPGIFVAYALVSNFISY